MSFIAKCVIVAPMCAARTVEAGLAVRLMPAETSGEFTTSGMAPTIESPARVAPAGRTERSES
jgi:hypothetical protein